jgi:hypothetical protein
MDARDEEDMRGWDEGIRERLDDGAARVEGAGRVAGMFPADGLAGSVVAPPPGGLAGRVVAPPPGGLAIGCSG